MTLLLLSFGVALDAAAVCSGMAMRGVGGAHLLKLAVTFGAFQFAMAFAGSLGGELILRHLSAVDHWVAFALLVGVGGKMVWEAWSAKEEEVAPPALSTSTLVTLGVATSVDAFAVGVTLKTLALPPSLSAASIGAVTFGLSLLAGWLGRRVGDRFGKSVELLGGLVLVALGVKTLVEHLHR